MKLLLHQCCGPCSFYPLKVLSKHHIDICTYFYNPNIHPFTEFERRLENARKVNNIFNVKEVIIDTYDVVSFLRSVVYKEQERCSICYYERLEKTAKYACEEHFDAFTTTLLYSKYQKHDLIKSICIELSKKYIIDFYYYDFREGFYEGIKLSKEYNIYRQAYCGCIYSEEERYREKTRNKK